MTLDEVLNLATKTAYHEADSHLHSLIIPRAVEIFAEHCNPPATVLDVGCGSCFGAKKLRDAGYSVTPLSIINLEVSEATAAGFEAHDCEMHKTLSLGKFDAIWCRHAAEHSPCPLLLLSNFRKQAEWLYLEVPLPSTSARHEINPNHYSCLVPGGWANLLRQTGWTIIQSQTIQFDLEIGPDSYLYFVCRGDNQQKMRP